MGIRLNRKKIHELDSENINKTNDTFEESKTSENPFEETNSSFDENPIETNENPFQEPSTENNPFQESSSDTNESPFQESSTENNNPFQESPNKDERPFQEHERPISTESITEHESDYSRDLVIDPEMPYFFVFGSSTAGKSSMLSGLLYHIKTSGIGQLRSLGLNDYEHHRKGDFILNRMTKKVRKGEFIEGSQTLDSMDFVFPTEINLEFEPNGKTNMPFCLLEMAGEDLAQIELRDGGRSGGEFDQRIEAYLKHPDCQLIFICVVDSDTPEDSEELIDQFLTYAHKLGHETNPVLLTVNKWDKIADKYTDVKDYIEKELPILKNHLFDENREMAYMKYSIGEVASDGTYKYNPTDSKKLLNWMYSIGVGASLDEEIKDSPISGLFKSVKNMFSNE